MSRKLNSIILAIVLLTGFSATTRAQGEKLIAADVPSSQEAIGDDIPAPTVKDRLLGFLPPTVSDDLDINLWGWVAGTRTNEPDYNNWYDVEFGLAVTKSFNQHVAISAQGNFIDADGTVRVELEQAYFSALISERSGCFITVGKFNANFGTEARDFWSRSTGSTSLLFGAQPQDLVGGILTVPVGATGISFKPFISEDFQGQYNFNQCPSAGAVVDYQPIHGVDFAVTNWVGPGFVLFGGHSLQQPYPVDAYGSDDPRSRITGNWQGPNLLADRGGTLYFVEAKATVQLTPELRAAAEFLQATSGTSLGRWGWWGALAQLDYDLTDKWRLFGRFSYLDDDDWLITGEFQRVYEYSMGSAYEILQGIEIRGEYRHDSSNVTGDDNNFSIHLALTY